MRIILFLFAVLITAGAAAQSPVIKIYAFSREIITGNVPVNRDGTPRKNNSYFIYVEVKKNTKPTIIINEFFVEGNCFKTVAMRVNSPVYKPQQGIKTANKKDELIAKTGNDLYELAIKEDITEATIVDQLKKKANNNPAMAVITQGKKKWYAFAKIIQVLPTVDSQ